MQVNLPTPASALAIGAHPDDVELSCGATLAKWAADGCVVHHLICTDGSAGSWDPDEDTVRLVVQRQDEQRAAARALGATGEVVFLGWRDGELESGLRQRWDVTYWIRRLRPQVVLSHDPWKRYRLHPDHRHAGFLAVEAVVAAREYHYFSEQHLEPHRPSALLLWKADEIDHVEDVEGFVDRKAEAVLAHRSQLFSTLGIRDPEDADEIERFHQRLTDQAVEAGRPAGVAYGEAFKALLEL